MWNIFWNCMAVVGIATVALSFILFVMFLVTSQIDYKKKIIVTEYDDEYSFYYLINADEKPSLYGTKTYINYVDL